VAALPTRTTQALTVAGRRRKPWRGAAPETDNGRRLGGRHRHRHELQPDLVVADLVSVDAG
jgi:hypothetical protein